MSQKIFLTGATGFVGCHLVKALSKEGNILTLLVRKNSDLRYLKNLNFNLVLGDINEVGTYQEFLRGIDIVFHLAGIVTDWAPKQLYYQVNTEGTKLLLNKAIESGVKKFIYLSIIDVLKRSRYKHNIINEFTEYTNTNLPYYRSKMLADKYVLENNGMSGIETIVVRSSWIYGKGDKILFPEIINLLKKSSTFFLIGKKNTQIPVIYIENLVDILLKIKDTSSSSGGGRIFLAADDEDITWYQLVNQIIERISTKNKIIFLPIWIGQFMGIILDLTFKFLKNKNRPMITSMSAELISCSIKIDSKRLQNDLKYKQKVSFQEGFINTMSSFIS